ncbi:ABC transporter permease [Candidatus Micrarchaeota archaeon]|nr:ABC transporter permease [Candidatus Micrarchaeota archaeon]
MRFQDLIFYSFKNIQRTQLRSWLTMLGIVVGISSVVILIGLAQGLSNEVTSELQSFNPRTIIVIPYSLAQAGQAEYAQASFLPSSGRLYEKDIDRLGRIPELELVSKVVYGGASVAFKDEEISAQVTAIEPDMFLETTSVELEKGRFLEENERHSVVIGNKIADGTFEKNPGINSYLTIGGKKFRIVGIMKEMGSSFGPSDSSIFINFEDGKDLFSESLGENELSAIRILIKEGFDVKEVTERIEEEIAASHRVSLDEKDFGVISPEFVNEQLESVTSVLAVFLGSIAIVSLLVGGIGISNTMFMNVIERRREIGVLKAIGAEDNDILNLFLLESSLMGLVGGIAGIIIGAAILSVINLFGITTYIGVDILIGGLFFSLIVGAVSGTLPARKAAEVSPMESLRYE